MPLPSSETAKEPIHPLVRTKPSTKQRATRSKASSVSAENRQCTTPANNTEKQNKKSIKPRAPQSESLAALKLLSTAAASAEQTRQPPLRSGPLVAKRALVSQKRTIPVTVCTTENRLRTLAEHHGGASNSFAASSKGQPVAHSSEELDHPTIRPGSSH